MDEDIWVAIEGIGSIDVKIRDGEKAVFFYWRKRAGSVEKIPREPTAFDRICRGKMVSL